MVVANSVSVLILVQVVQGHQALQDVLCITFIVSVTCSVGNPCMHGATCTEDTCVCDSGWTGTLCDICKLLEICLEEVKMHTMTLTLSQYSLF